MGSAVLVNDGSAGIAAHARRAHQMRVASFLYDLLRARGLHYFHHLVLAEFDHSFVVVVEVKRDLCHRDTEAIFLIGKLDAVLRPGKNFTE